MDDLSATGIVAFSFALKLGGFVVAVALIMTLTRWWDRYAGLRFADVMAIIRSQPVAAGIYYGARFLAVCILAASILGCAPAAAQTFTSAYDAPIKRSVERWWPDYPFWKAWKAQLYQESLLKPDAVSPVGAMGLAQFMPGTWREVSRKLGVQGLSPHMVEPAIEAGAYYMASLRRQWSAPRPQDDRLRLAQASYNAGLGNILAAQRKCGGPPLYADIIACLPAITGRHSRETTTYVDRIRRWWLLMEAA